MRPLHNPNRCTTRTAAILVKRNLTDFLTIEQFVFWVFRNLSEWSGVAHLTALEKAWQPKQASGGRESAGA